MHISAFVKVDNGMFIERPQEDMVAPEYIWVPLPDDGPNPDPINQRYSGDPDDPFRAATPEEIAEARDYKVTIQANERLSESIQTEALVNALDASEVLSKEVYINALKDLIKEQ